MSDEILFAFRRNLVVAASAGTGKTHSLVGVVIHLLLGASELGRPGRLHPPVEPSRLVATTFSRKAAAEIRARIVEELERMAAGFEGRYGDALAEARVRCGDRPWSVAERSRLARAALERFGQAQVGTLHAFAASLVRDHALEVGLVPGFELADEDEDGARLDAALATALERSFLRDPKLARELVDVAGGVDSAIAQLGRALRRLEEDGRGVEALAIDTGDALAIERAMGELVAQARALRGDPKLGGAASELVAAWDAGDEAEVERGAARLCGVAATGKKTPEAERFFELRERLPGSSKRNAERGRRLAHAWRIRARASAMPLEVKRILAEADAERRRRVSESSALGFGDVLRTARDLLRDRPDVAARISRGMDVLLVDEFQDTSRLQRELVTLLWARDEARVEGGVPRLADVRPHGLFVVGDRKQSIYGFRGADVGVFAELCVALAGDAARTALGIPPGVAWEPESPTADFVSLRHNRRGRPGLLAFANAFSRRILRPSGPPPVLYEIDYVPDTEDLLVPPGEAEPVEPRTRWLRPRIVDKSSTRTEEAWAIAARARHLVERGEIMVGDSAVRWRDLAVLALTNDMLDAMAFAFAEAGIPYVVEGRAFFAAREVRDLRAMLALVLDPRDRLALLEVLRGPWAGVHDRTLLGLTEPHRGLAAPGDAWDRGERRALVRAEDRAALDAVRRVVSELHPVHDRLGPGDTLREAVKALALEETLARLPRGAQRVANVRKLIALAEEHRDAASLLARIDHALARDVPETEAPTFSDADDAVRLLTIHASKGLSFPVVFVPQVGAAPQARGPGLVAIEVGEGDAPSRIACKVLGEDGGVYDVPSYARALESDRRRLFAERRRLLYVAATRAEQLLFWVGTREPTKVESAGWAATAAASLLEVAAAPGAEAHFVVEDVDVERPQALVEQRTDAIEVERVPRVAAPEWRALPIAPTLLQDFHHCPRRFELVHLLGLPERPLRGAATSPSPVADDADLPSLDARDEGTLAHAVLERVDAAAFGSRDARDEVGRVLAAQGIPVEHARHASIADRVARFLSTAYAARVREHGARVQREHPFVMDLPDERGRVVSLRGTIDLLVAWPDGSVDVVDYKRARGPSGEPYAFQLGVYALAARASFPAATAVRRGVVFLGGKSAEPTWLDAVDLDELRAAIAALGARLVEARFRDEFSRVSPDRCRAIRCGFVGTCHPT